MERRPLFHANLNVSVVSLGTMTWGEQNTEAEAHAQLEWAMQHGINFVDTAEMYPVPPRAEDRAAHRDHSRQLARPARQSRQDRAGDQDRRARPSRLDPQRCRR